MIIGWILFALVLVAGALGWRTEWTGSLHQTFRLLPAADGRITADDLAEVQFADQEATLHALDLQITVEEIDAGVDLFGFAAPLTVEDIDRIHAEREAGPIRNLLRVQLPGGKVAHYQEDPLSEGAGDPPGPGLEKVICGKSAEGAEPAKEGTRLCKSCIKGRDAYPAVYGVPGG